MIAAIIVVVIAIFALPALYAIGKSKGKIAAPN